MITRQTGAQWLLFAFVADRPPGAPEDIRTVEGELRWVRTTDIPRLPVVSDLPLMLPHLLSAASGVLMGKIWCANDDMDCMLDHDFRIS